MAKTICKILGVVFVLVGICGFVLPELLGAHLNLTHNVIHIVSGAIALYFGFAGTASGAKAFCLVFGVVYLALAVLGFVLGHEAVSSLPGMADMGADPKLWTVLRGTLELGQRDHIIHLILGIIFIAGGLLTKRGT